MKQALILSVVILMVLAGTQVLAHGPKHKTEKTGVGGLGHSVPIGKPGNSKNVSREVVVQMFDTMRFKPDHIVVSKNETIQFIVQNKGRVKHEMVLGTIKELQEHAKLMQKFPEMEHDDPNAVTVEAGKTASLIWQFTRAGRFDFACLIPGHYEAGMAGKIVVESETGPKRKMRK
jgi:uncharacterized cupredoxin-like copper-binding protein